MTTLSSQHKLALGLLALGGLVITAFLGFMLYYVNSKMPFSYLEMMQ